LFITTNSPLKMDVVRWQREEQPHFTEISLVKQNKP